MIQANSNTPLAPIDDVIPTPPSTSWFRICYFTNNTLTLTLTHTHTHTHTHIKKWKEITDTPQRDTKKFRNPWCNNLFNLSMNQLSLFPTAMKINHHWSQFPLCYFHLLVVAFIPLHHPTLMHIQRNSHPLKRDRQTTAGVCVHLQPLYS